MKNFKPACHVQSILTYSPVYGDYLVWSKWFTTWHGFLVDFDQKGDCSFVIAGLPIFLVNQNLSNKSIKVLKLDKIRNSGGAKFTIIRHTNEYDLPMWFV